MLKMMFQLAESSLNGNKGVEVTEEAMEEESEEAGAFKQKEVEDLDR